MSLQRDAVATAHGKLLLFGEHAAVYNRPAVGMSLPLDLTISATPTAGGGITGDGIPQAELLRMQSAIARAVALPNLRVPEHFRLKVVSLIPRGSGFGSSAALCVACAAVLLEMSGHTAAEVERRIWEVAHEMERVYHGTPSGIDTGLALHHGLSVFSASEDTLPVRRSLRGPSLFVVAVATPRAGSTGELVGNLGKRMALGDSKALDAIAELGSIAEEAAELLGNGEARDDGVNAERVAALANRAHTVLSSLGLSSADVERVIEQGIETGALGGKLSGAGGGGAVYLLYRDHEALVRGAADLKRALRDVDASGAWPLFAVEWDGQSVRLVDT